MNIWLAYVSYPVTTAVYIERALRRKHRVISMGPELPEQLLDEWNLGNMKLPVKPLDISLPQNVDMKAASEKIAQIHTPDLYLWIESVNMYFPANIDAIPCTRACYLIDSHLNLQLHLKWAKNFDHVFIAQREYLDNFKNAGIKKVHWLPLGCDPYIHKKSDKEKLYDVGFVGSVHSGSDRENYLRSISEKFNVHIERSFWDEMAETLSRSKIVFNNAVRNDLNMRVFETLSTGAFLLTDDPLKSGMLEMFKDGEDLAVFNKENLFDKIEYYLEHEKEREEIAARGYRLVRAAHTYSHRADELIKAVIGESEDTPDAAEWRRRSLKEPAPESVSVSRKTNRSFVIPVLNYSPGSSHSIVTLLDDLSMIDGTVIVIFNSPDMAESLKDHSRIDHYAAMSSNFGVSRAWNIGINMAETPYVFILNSDLQITEQAIVTLEDALRSLPDAAAVGPEGSFFEFKTQSDLVRFLKGHAPQPVPADAVSGFFFAVKRELFENKTLKFENSYTPAWFEEWDLGLQIKAAGLKSYIVPTFGYDHEFTNKKEHTAAIRYLDREEKIEDIMLRNERIFKEKWLKAAGLDSVDQIVPGNPNSQFLISGCRNFFLSAAQSYLEKNNYDLAYNTLNILSNAMPGEKTSFLWMGKIAAAAGRGDDAQKHFRRALEIDPDYNEAKVELDKLK